MDDPAEVEFVVEMASQQHRPPGERLDGLDVVGCDQGLGGEVAEAFRQPGKIIADPIETSEVGDDSLLVLAVDVVGLEDAQVSVVARLVDVHKHVGLQGERAAGEPVTFILEAIIHHTSAYAK